jgi:hypothetical protein
LNKKNLTVGASLAVFSLKKKNRGRVVVCRKVKAQMHLENSTVTLQSDNIFQNQKPSTFA